MLRPARQVQNPLTSFLGSRESRLTLTVAVTFLSEAPLRVILHIKRTKVQFFHINSRKRQYLLI